MVRTTPPRSRAKRRKAKDKRSKRGKEEAELSCEEESKTTSAASVWADGPVHTIRIKRVKSTGFKRNSRSRSRSRTRNRNQQHFKCQYTYKGCYKNGARDGPGTVTWSDGSTFTSTFHNGVSVGGKTSRFRWKVLYSSSTSVTKTPTHTYTSPFNVQDGSKFIGSIKDGRPWGKGERVWKSGDRYQGVYGGGVDVDKANEAQGDMVFVSGHGYSGELKDFVPHGEGVYRWYDGRVDRGQFRNGKLCGHSVMTWILAGDDDDDDDDEEITCRYVGGVEDGELNGVGTMTHSNNSRWECVYVDNERHGAGKEWLPDGSHYVGNFQHDFRHDVNGRRVMADGSVYSGEFVLDAFHGKGTLRYPDSNSPNRKVQFTGEFVEGKIRGEGTMCEIRGNKRVVLTGMFDEGVLNGEAKESIAGGSCFEGSFRDGRRHGSGVLVDSKGVRVNCSYENGLLHGRSQNGFKRCYYWRGKKLRLVEYVKAMERELQRLNSGCIICQSKKPTHVLFNCKHMCVCASCANSPAVKEIAYCPMCRETNVNFFQVFSS